MPISDLEFLQIQTMLDKIGVIDFQYQKEKKKDSFNIFNLLIRKFDEVNLHSRFIYELLNPEGSHGFENLFLNTFLANLQITDISLENVKVRKEYKNIDLLITNKSQAVIIENKLWANDRWEQLQGYYEKMVNEGFKDIRVVYLSIDGRPPEDFSIGTLSLLADWEDIFFMASYENDIDRWLESCIKEAYDKPTLRETLVQYKLLVNEISGKTMNKDERDEIIHFLAQGDNILRAKKIAENWKDIRWFTEWDFWNDLEKTIKAEYQIMDTQKYDSHKLDSVVHHSRNRNPWYGIMIKIGEYDNTDACIFIERGQGDVYYGLTMILDHSKWISNDEKFNGIAKKLESFSDWEKENHWLGGNYCEPKINFTNFSNDATLKLVNENYRRSYVTSLWHDIKKYIEMVRIAINEENA